MADLVDAHIRFIEITTSRLHLQLVEVVDGAVTRTLLEQACEVALRISHIAQNIVYSHVVLNVFTHVMNGRTHGIDIVAFLVRSASIEFEVSHRGEIVMQQGRSIAKVLEAISALQGLHDFLKDVVPVAYARVGGGSDALRL